MLDYLYTGEYPAEKQRWPPSDLLLHAQMFQLGIEQEIPKLREIAFKKYSDKVTTKFNPIEYLDSIPTVFDCFWRWEELEELVVRVGREKLRLHLQNDSVREKYIAVIERVPNFAIELLDSFWKAPVVYGCPDCIAQIYP